MAAKMRSHLYGIHCWKQRSQPTVRERRGAAFVPVGSGADGSITFSCKMIVVCSATESCLTERRSAIHPTIFQSWSTWKCLVRLRARTRGHGERFGRFEILH